MKKLFSVLLVAMLFLAIGNLTFAQNVNVSSTVPVTSTNYATLKLATQAINNGTHGSLAGGGNAITVKLNGNLTEPASDTIRNATGTPITIFPTVTVVIGVTTQTTAALLVLDHSSNVTLDGRLNGTGAKSLTIKHVVSNNRAVKMVNGSNNNVIRYTDMIGLSITAGTMVDINASVGVGNNNNTVEFCNIKRCTRAIQTFGGTGAGNSNLNSHFNNNRLSNFTQMGINCSIGSEGGEIKNNEILIDSVATTGLGTTHVYAIQVLSTGNWVVANNNCHDLTKIGYTAGYGILGMLIEPIKPTNALTTRIDIYNNMISMTSNANSNFCDILVGLYIADGGIFGSANDGVPFTSNAYNNSMLVGGDGLAFDDLSWGMLNSVGGGINGVHGCTVNCFNNISKNTRFNGGAASQMVGQEIDTAGGLTLTADNNFAISTDPSFGWNAAFNGFLYEGISAYKNAACEFGIEKYAMFKDVNFVSNSDLHLAGPIGGDMNGKPTALVTTDIDGAARNALYPYRGADEKAALRITTLSGCLEEKVADGEVTIGFYNGCGVKSTSTGYFDPNTNTCIVTVGDSIASATPYSLRVESTNHLESWSATTMSFSPNGNYNFISSGIFGGNASSGGCFLAGDVNQDSIIDAGDMLDIYNEVPLVLTGCRLQNDANSDEVVDAGDLLVTYNNIPSVWTVASPCPEPASITSNQAILKTTKMIKRASNNLRLSSDTEVATTQRSR